MLSKTNQIHRFLQFSFLTALVLLLLRLLFMSKTPLLVEEAYYWNYAQHLDYSYLDHPPMVALLIKLGVTIWGDTEWGVRFATLPCWLLTCFFSYRLTQSIKPGAGIYTLLFLSFLPFFFIYSLIITPDIPLIMAWSAALLYLYQATALNKASSWYAAGIWIGIGLLSKYTIVLLGAATFIYVLIIPDLRHWFTRKEPYLAALISILIFSPVIYWNSTHHWVSFLFQTSNRFNASDSMTLHIWLGLVILFFTPVGIIETARLFSLFKERNNTKIPRKTQLFFLIYTGTPILVFAVFSMFHQIKFNWIGPSLLAIIPWLSIALMDNTKVVGWHTKASWSITFFVTFLVYCAMYITLLFGWPQSIHQEVTYKLPDWSVILRQIDQKAQDIYSKYHQTPTIVALDKYNIASELIFYQNKLQKQHQHTKQYPILGAHLFGLNGLMFNYWDNLKLADDKYLILVSNRLFSFNAQQIHKKTEPVTLVEPLDKSDTENANRMYYQIVKMK